MGKLKGTTSPDYAVVLTNIAIFYKRRKQLNKSLSLHLECLRIRENSNPSLYASTLNNIGAVYEWKGDLDIALRYMMRCAKIWSKLLK